MLGLSCQQTDVGLKIWSQSGFKDKNGLLKESREQSIDLDTFRAEMMRRCQFLTREEREVIVVKLVFNCILNDVFQLKKSNNLDMFRLDV